ncbi:uncharacterized protein [Diabrotica undecimpunctata]|uniref:uncharacterized protein n=1 Tax=Diabrotica undecimpunctata TaxID=50387 RepID=UPI003B635526
MLQYVCFVGVYFLTSIHCISCLEPSVEVEVPISVKVGNSATLGCNFKPKNKEDHLVHVRWFKENEEFYRFTPDLTPSKRTFIVPGVIVNVEESSDTNVVLENLQKNLTGNYTCEVHWFVPIVVTAKDSKEMYVMDELKGEIILTTNDPSFDREKVFGICISPASEVTPKYTWLLNGQQVSTEVSQPPTENSKEPKLFISYLKGHRISFIDDKANLTCAIEVNGVYKAQKTLIFKRKVF